MKHPQDGWYSWDDDPPPIITCHVRQGCHSSVPLIVITNSGEIFDDVWRGYDGLCHCFSGGRIYDLDKWSYAPGAWAGVVIDKAKIELELIRKMMDSGLIPKGDPEMVANDLYDPRSY